ncbi:hypothetical protein N7527_001639 [Penicillium freii]|nr:hypothetical protein N7527_001639 [Penicillium freii]
MNFVDRIELCKFAYDHRVSVYIGKLTTEALQEESISGPAGMRSCFALARHHILRLAHHIRAPKELVADSCHLGHLLQAHNVRGADSLPSVPPPVRDSHTNLRGILNRMYRTDGEEKKTVEDGLLYLNRASFSNIFEHFMEQYTLPGTQVHAEVQVLEHFYRRRLSFVDGDKFVACSKPACLCCELYFRHHPARMVVPSSHCKVWTRWSPPLVKEFTKNSTAAREQKQIMSKITQALRDQIIDQVLRRTQMSQWHPDSRTYVTEFRPLDSFNLFEEKGKICKNGEFVADILDSTEGESEELVEDIDSDDGGVSIKV